VSTGSNELLKTATMSLNIGKALSERLQHFVQIYVNRKNPLLIDTNNNHGHKNGDNGDSNIVDRNTELFQQLEFVETNQEWISVSIKTISTIMAAFLVNFLKQFSSIVSTCIFGTQVVINSIQTVIDPILQKHGFLSVVESPIISTTLRLGLFTAGLFLNLQANRYIPLVLKGPLAPFFLFENFLNRIFDKK
jgi:hypothetical protein